MRRLNLAVSTSRLARASATLSAWLNERLKRALPGYCAFCHAGVDSGKPWCAACYVDMPWNLDACTGCAEPLPRLTRETPLQRLCGRCLKNAPALAHAWVPLRYEGRALRLIQRYKFQGDPRAGEILLQLLLSTLKNAPPLAGAIIGVPGQRARTRERGFDHVARLAQGLAVGSNLPVVAATRCRETPTQLGLDRRQRRSNIRHAFTFGMKLPKTVVVLDDVVTTGATLDSLARACRAAGAEQVVGLAFARTPSARI